MAAEFNGTNNGQIEYAARFGADRLGVGKDRVNRALKRLEFCQLIRCTRRGTNRHEASLWYLPYCEQLEQTENSSVSLQGRFRLTTGTLAPGSVSSEGQLEERIESKNPSKRNSGAKRPKSDVDKREADQREADLLLLDEYRRRAAATKAAADIAVEVAIKHAANGGGGTTTVSS
jgi:hypothetical protein